jgi:hypothetical protein
MKITANFATYKPREEALKKAVASIIDQVDEVRIHFNGYDVFEVPMYFQNMEKVFFSCLTDYTDNAKFEPLDCEIFDTSSEYYFSCDDDIIYPCDYVEKTIDNIKKYGIIISYHGRKLQGLNRNYYRGHKSFRCLDEVSEDTLIDVCGTGVTAFDTRYFHPKGIATDPRHRMSDLLFSLEASKQKKSIGCCSHKKGWIKDISHKENIYNTESRNPSGVQEEIANEIFKLNHGK